MPEEKPKRILIATDAWHPQVNGVVRTLESVAGELRKLGHEVKVLSPEGRKTIGLPTYPEIRLAWISRREIGELVESFRPDCIHIATEGPVGLAVRRFCLRNMLQFTTGFHTRFAEYARARVPLPGVLSLTYRFLRWFHGPSKAVLAPAKSITDELRARGFANVLTWTRGVDHATFRQYDTQKNPDWQSPVMVYVGRLAVEKGIEDFLELQHPGTKLVIGDGPDRRRLERKYPGVVFTGYLFGEELARTISSGDVFVFPSRTDTFGLVMLEAMACGLPVAAYPVTGPVDVVDNGRSGCLDDQLAEAVACAVRFNREDAVAHAAKFTWENTAEMMLDSLVPVRPGARAAE